MTSEQPSIARTVISLGGATLLFDGVGNTWVVRPGKASELLVGADEGLVRVFPVDWRSRNRAADRRGVPAHVQAGRSAWLGGGQCAMAGEGCNSQPDGCCLGLTSSSGIVPTCELSASHRVFSRRNWAYWRRIRYPCAGGFTR